MSNIIHKYRIHGRKKGRKKNQLITNVVVKDYLLNLTVIY